MTKNINGSVKVDMSTSFIGSQLKNAQDNIIIVDVDYFPPQNFRGSVESISSDSSGEYILLKTEPGVMHQLYYENIFSLASSSRGK